MYNNAHQNIFVALQTEAESNTQSFKKALLQKIKQNDPRQQSKRFNFMAQVMLPFYQSNCLTGRKRLRHMLISTTEVDKVSSTNPQLWIQVLTSTFWQDAFYWLPHNERDRWSPVFLEIKPFLSDNTLIVASEILAAPNFNMNPVNTIELNKICEEFEHLKHIWFPNVDDNKNL